MNRKSQLHSAKQTIYEDRLEFEKLLADISAKFVALSFDQVDDEIHNAMKEVLGFFKIHLCALLKLLPGKTSWRVTHFTDATGTSPVPVGIDLPISLVPWAAKKLAEERESFSFSRLEDLPEEATIDKQKFKEWEITSGLYIPIAALASSEYTIGINSINSNQTWPEEYIPRLRLLGEIFVNAIERSRGERALRESEERLNLAASAADAGLWTMSMDTGLIWATQKLRELFQIALEEELSFDRFLAAVHPDDRKRVRELVQQTLERQEAFNIEYRIMWPDGIIRWILTSGSPGSKVSGLPERLMGVSIDITERKRIEAELQERLEENQKLKLQLENENVYLREQVKSEGGFETIVGDSDELNYVLFRAKQVAPTDATVLILGETGTGKGMLATALHEMSTRKDRPMITINCAALPANLIESELFGREKGAFTGAHAKQVGRFEIAHGGTIFLDEIGEMPLELQAKLLRVLQEGEFERLGSPRTIKVDVRVIASTSRDLKDEVHNERFREDLYYRLNVFPVTVPPLRMRASDIPQLVNFFVDKYARKYGRQFETIPKNMIKTLQGYHWPGNVRELQHVIERAVITSPGPVLSLADLFKDEGIDKKEKPLKELEEMEREHILKVLQKTRWKINGEGGAASILKLHPSTLRFRIKKLGIKRT
ncbi:MAG: sigma 54-interacting transcriptional regulator [Syntrophales bacterium]|jgi:PAS domain S-box-containing protein